MKKSIQITFLLVSLTFANAQEKLVTATANLLTKASQSKTLAVLPLESRIATDKDAGKTASEVVVSVAKAQGFKLVERAQLAQMMKEQQLSASGLINEESAIELGNLLSAQTLVMGSVAELMGDRLITLKLINAETGEILNSETVSMGPDAFKTMQKELLGEATQTSAVVFRSALIPGWGQMYAGKSTRGALWLGAFAVSVGGGVYTTLAAGSKYDEYLELEENYKDSSFEASKRIELCPNSCSQSEFNSLKTKNVDQEFKGYEDALNVSYIVWGVAGAVWAGNLIDAWIVGSERKQKMDLYFGAIPNLKGGVDLQLALSF